MRRVNRVIVQKTRFAVATASVLFAIILAQIVSAQISAEEVFAAQYRRFQALHSFSGSSTKVKVYDGGSAPTDDWDLSNIDTYLKDGQDYLIQTTEFYVKGELFLSSWDSKESGKDPVRVDTAYDGSHQTFQRDTGDLIVHEARRGLERQPYVVPPAALDPYNFALYDLEKPRSFEVLRDEETWLTLRDSATVVGEETVDGHPCIVIEIEVPGNVRGSIPVMSRVYFAKDLDFFPVQTERFQVGTGYMFQRYRARDIAYVENPEGDGIFVNRLGIGRTWDWFGSGEVTAGFLSETDLDSVAVNPDLPDSVFTVPVVHARVYINELEPSLSFSIPDDADLFRELVREMAEEGVETVGAAPLNSPVEAEVSLRDETLVDDAPPGPGWPMGLLLMTMVGLVVMILGFVLHTRSRNAIQELTED